MWEGAHSSVGYGKLWDGEIVELAHRVSYRLHKGDIPDGLYVCHKCDNRACVNPDHLFLGTATDNMQDMISKGRGYTPREANSKLTKAQVDEIRAMPKKLPFGALTDIAARYGLSVGGFHKVRVGLRWGHV